MLVAGALVFRTDDYVIAGVLLEIAAGFGVPTAVADQLVPAVPLPVAVVAPITAVLTDNVRCRTVLTAATSVLVLVNALAAVAPSFELLLGLRVLAGPRRCSGDPRDVRHRRAARPVAVVALWGGAAFWNSSAIRARLHLLAGPASGQAFAMNTSGTCPRRCDGGAVGGAGAGRWWARFSSSPPGCGRSAPPRAVHLRPPMPVDPRGSRRGHDGRIPWSR